MDEKVIPKHLHPALEGASELTTEEKSRAYHLILEMEDHLLSPGGKTGKTDWDDHGMNTQNNCPLNVGYRRLPMA